MAQLTYNTPDGEKTYEIDEEPVTIGRQLGNVLTLKDDQLSRFHAVIEWKRGILGVRDLGSRNGTRVNGELVKSKKLETGDVVRVGTTDIKVDLEASGGNGQAEAVGVAFQPDAEQAAAAGESPVKTVASLAGGLPNREVKPSDLTLLNARGKVAAEKDGEAAASEAMMLLRLTLLVCLRTGASDIHLEPRQDGYTLRVRIDGGMVDLAKLNRGTGVRFASVVKVLSDVDISKKDQIQEGSFATRLPDRRVDYRVSFTPGLYGQKLVVRVLDTANSPQYLWDLGLPEHAFEILDRTTRRDSGMVLVSGPTGSGKTATLYAMLRSLDVRERNVVTIEDPVEIRLDGITQQPVNEAGGNTFGALLRSVLRQDPDVVLVGEIRDEETAQTAAQAAMTGHLVFSTTHSKDTVGTVYRLIDLGADPYVLASGLQVVLAQRLVRTLCDKCKRPRQATQTDKSLLGREIETVHDPVGCRKCLGTGYRGRQAVFEVLHVNDAVRDAIQSGGGPAAITQALKTTGFKKLRDHAADLVEEGATTVDEADRVAN